MIWSSPGEPRGSGVGVWSHDTIRSYPRAAKEIQSNSGRGNEAVVFYFHHDIRCVSGRVPNRLYLGLLRELPAALVEHRLGSWYPPGFEALIPHLKPRFEACLCSRGWFRRILTLRGTTPMEHNLIPTHQSPRGTDIAGRRRTKKETDFELPRR